MASMRQQLVAAIALVLIMEATTQDLPAPVTDHPPAYHRSPIIELPPHVTLDDTANRPAITLDLQEPMRITVREQATETPVVPDDLPHRLVTGTQFAPNATVQGTTAPVPSMGWLPSDVIPMRPLRGILRTSNLYDDGGFVPGPIVTGSYYFGQG